MQKQDVIEHLEQRERLLNQDKVAEILGVSPKTLEYWRWKNLGPRFIKVGKLVRYLESDIQGFIGYLAEGGKV